MTQFKIISTLINRDGVLSTAWSAVQQLVVASSTYFILEAIRFATAGNFDLACRFMIGFAISLIFVFVPLSLSTLYLEKWRFSSFELFVQAFKNANAGKTTYAHAKVKARFESWLTNESAVVYDSATSTLYQIFSTLLNSTFNIVVIAVALDKRLLFWYIAAGLVLVASNTLLKNTVARSASDLQESRKALSSTMLGAWENVLMGNRYNRENWMLDFGTGVIEARQSAAKYNNVRSMISGATVSAAMLIIGVGNAFYLSEKKTNMVAVAALIITMPRQLQIIQSILGLFSYYLGWLGCREQLQGLENVVALGRHVEDVTGHIQLDQIEIPGKGTDLESTLASVANHHAGRLTIRGQNGAGKSTFLTVFAEQTGDQSFLLHAKYSDLLFSEPLAHHSDGKRLLAAFKEIGGLNDVRYVILDEWDANLDEANMALISAAIDELVKSKVVIESRHRSG